MMAYIYKVVFDLIYCMINNCFRIKKKELFDIDLQWFAAEDEGRTEDPTEHKIKKAREEGKVAKSVEFTSAIILIFGIVTIGILSNYILSNAMDMVKYFFSNSAEIDITTDHGLVLVFYNYFLKMTVPVVLVVFIAALLANLLQVGFLFTAKPIVPDFSKIVPRFGKFFKKAMFSQEALFNLGKSIFKIIVISIVVYINISSEMNRMFNLLHMPFLVSVGFVASIAFRIVVEAAIILLVFSIFDYMFQRKLHRESLKMSKQEIKEERKMMEQDPLVKSRLRERMREILTRNMMKAVPEADVVITNPTHFAVAMEWDRLKMPAPVVVAKGADHIALRIKEIALENNVPVVENKPLARALHSEVEIGDAIPEQYYEVMATILAQVYKLSGKTA
jgi:flagellar biosynthesis protein FlhB